MTPELQKIFDNAYDEMLASNPDGYIYYEQAQRLFELAIRHATVAAFDACQDELICEDEHGSARVIGHLKSQFLKGEGRVDQL